jgi:hypothetical protein
VLLLGVAANGGVELLEAGGAHGAKPGGVAAERLRERRAAGDAEEADWLLRAFGRLASQGG